ncbi:hypothetical protein [Priestia megaterium]|uniref:hypothetical protein n=1 Tax=Priestia megaterium TaxID=1404 RepID=UPI000BED0A26|nr:hypothetical protein [Priestia megaterium]PED63954.1 hypothetical protein CON20_23590 [Priestia megaterium]
MDAILKAIQEMNQSLSKEIKDGFSSVNERLDKVESRLANLETNSNEDVVALLKQIERNTNGLQQDIEFLTGKVGNHDRILNRLNNN